MLRAPIPPHKLDFIEKRAHVKNELERMIKCYEWNKEEDSGITPVKNVIL